MKLYCQKCGSGTEYSFERPKFCAHCANNFGNQVIKPQITKQRTASAQVITPKEDSEEGNERVPDISKLDFEIDVSQRKGEKIGNLMGTKGSSQEEDRQPNGVFSREQALESFKKEAGFYPARQEINEED